MVFVGERRLNFFILGDVGLIVLMGMLSLTSRDSLYFKLKPAMVEGIMAGVIALSIYSPANLVFRMSRRYMKGFSQDGGMDNPYREMLRPLLVVFTAHTILIVVAALWMSRVAWGVVGAGLFYTFFALYGLWIYRHQNRQRSWRKRYRDEEWFDIVDEEGRRLGTAPRSVCHSGRGDCLHSVVHLHVMIPDQTVVLQKRATHKKVQPGKWDTAVGGHLAAGESVKEALKREAEEEIGLHGFQPVFMGRYIWCTDLEKELVFMFATTIRGTGVLAVDNDEVTEVRGWSLESIKKRTASGIFTPNFLHELPILEKEVLKNR